ncbi:peptide chain release factor N(5)-glutamine methyltransferase [Planococcus lenghuensis]|uniref:Release factor glutamine methyltransferase n=1 Tax=Planococcus lenghuensis TaxID=2213202 RepID=A0A1Q2L2J6_9BACL|nr:peptide chain release factor N(5)-glutamine methyltransferase [Planococcus lenghuensis]AQQ54287.1 protein-(glutamine-N5) methyltransferase, release factor-specific [Planococcus lenghuensis]
MNSKDKRIYEALNGASSYLKAQGREEGAARILLQHVLGLNQTALLASLRDPLDNETEKRYFELINQHAAGIPVQHLTGQEEFYGRTFLVNPDVLIPRPETEELIEETLRLIPEVFGNRQLNVADIGTGSGIIGITMKCELPEAQVTATDISRPALETAQKNADRLDAEVAFRLGHLTGPLAGSKWDVVLSNPPYIGQEEADTLADTVRDHEPHTALFADRHGLSLYEELAEKLPALMNRPALIGFEIGYMQGQAVKQLLEQAFPKAETSVKQDINGKDRMVFCIIR